MPVIHSEADQLPHEVADEFAPFEAALAAVEERLLSGERVGRGIPRLDDHLDGRREDDRTHRARSAARAWLVEDVLLDGGLHLIRRHAPTVRPAPGIVALTRGAVRDRLTVRRSGRRYFATPLLRDFPTPLLRDSATSLLRYFGTRRRNGTLASRPVSAARP